MFVHLGRSTNIMNDRKDELDERRRAAWPLSDLSKATDLVKDRDL